MQTWPCVIGTWPFSREPAIKAMECLCHDSTVIDAIEAGINVAELDPKYGCYHVGCGGWQNAEHVLELDAAIMNGADLNFGAVTALQGFNQPISVARRVMEKSQHSMLTAEGAAKFAHAQGFHYLPNLGQSPKPALAMNSSSNDRKCQDHDTLGLLALDRTGNICAGVSTSGISGKEPGRVGDSALPGCGLYADNEAGAACCSGDGDEILKYCPSYKVVDLMKQGYNPGSACLTVAKEIFRRQKNKKNFEIVLIALDNKGNHGAANIGVHNFLDAVTSQEFTGFPYVWLSDNTKTSEIISVPPLTENYL